MSKKSVSNHANRGNASNQVQKPGREERPNQENSSMQAHARKQNREEGSGNGSDYRQQIKEKKLAEGAKSKDGCLPKLFMLLLPFMAVGAYLVHRL